MPTLRPEAIARNRAHGKHDVGVIINRAFGTGRCMETHVRDHAVPGEGVRHELAHERETRFSR